MILHRQNVALGQFSSGKCSLIFQCCSKSKALHILQSGYALRKYHANVKSFYTGPKQQLFSKYVTFSPIYLSETLLWVCSLFEGS